MKNKLLEIAKVIQENPELPVLVFTDEEVCGEYKWNWVGNGYAMIEDVLLLEEHYTFGEEDILEKIKEFNWNKMSKTTEWIYKQMQKDGKIKKHIVVYLEV